MDIKDFLNEETKVKYDKLREKTGKHLAGYRYEKIEEDQGYRFLLGFGPYGARYAFNEWEMKNNGVYVCSFPKTGCTWTRHIVRYLLYMHDKAQLAISKALSVSMTSIELFDKTNFEIIDEVPLQRLVFWSHLPEALFDVNQVVRKNGKIIYVYRNPKDQAVSWFHFAHSDIYKYHPFPKDWNEFIEDYMNGKHHMNSKEGEFYPHHIREWYKHKDNPNVLFVCFEELKKDLPRQIKRIGKFLDIEVTEKTVEEIAQLCSFQYMKEQFVGDRKMFVRKGNVGEWKHQFTVAQSEKMDKIFATILQGVDLEFIYEL